LIQLLPDILLSLRINKLNLFSTMLKIRLELRLILFIKRMRVLETKLYFMVKTLFLRLKMPRLLKLVIKLLL
jgi:hypothetical protein